MHTLLVLLQVSLKDKESFKDVPSKQEWCQLFKISEEQAVSGLTLLGVDRLEANQRPPQDILFQWIGVGEMIRQQNALMDKAVVELCKELDELEIRYMVVKGQTLNAIYPEKGIRQSGDIDFFIHPDCWERAYKHFVISLGEDKIDTHTEKHIEWENADQLSSSYLIDIANCWLIDRDRWNGTSQNRLKTPFSSLVSNLMRPMFTVIKDKDEFDIYLCVFEKLLAMYYYMLISSTMRMEEFRHHAPIGQFAWQSFYLTRKKDNKYDAFYNEIADLKEQSSQLRGGLFEGKFELFSEAYAEVNEIEKRAIHYMI